MVCKILITPFTFYFHNQNFLAFSFFRLLQSYDIFKEIFLESHNVPAGAYLPSQIEHLGFYHWIELYSFFRLLKQLIVDFGILWKRKQRHLSFS